MKHRTIYRHMTHDTHETHYTQDKYDTLDTHVTYESHPKISHITLITHITNNKYKIFLSILCHEDNILNEVKQHAGKSATTKYRSNCVVDRVYFN